MPCNPNDTVQTLTSREDAMCQAPVVPTKSG